MKDEKKVVAVCPTCGKNVVSRKSKKGKIFYGCEAWPDCSFVSWDIPANEKCPNCEEEMIVKLYKNLKVISCKKCNYNRKEKRENVSGESQSEPAYAEIDNSSQIPENSIDILNQLDEQNER